MTYTCRLYNLETSTKRMTVIIIMYIYTADDHKVRPNLVLATISMHMHACTKR